MIEHILKNEGIACKIGGNYGVAALDLLSDETPDRVSLLELSSFQLMTQQRSPQIAVILKTTSEHLDWHRSVEEYRDAKANLVRYQKPSDTCVYLQDAEGSREIAAQGRSHKLRFGHSKECDVVIEDESIRAGETMLKLADCAVTGIHQLENMAAAALAVQPLGVSFAKAFQALKSYAGLTYRLEFKGTYQGISFYNDSYATRPEAAMAAAASMKQPFALILGGSEKHADFAEMSSLIAGLSLLKGIALIGQTAGRLRSSLEASGYTGPLTDHPGLEEAFAWSCSQVQGGGAVLMSPACASFGLFANYKERGKRFDELVKARSLA
jgi:UDP-N-acetylmuramoylalanine--D-glutamate ligase